MTKNYFTYIAILIGLGFIALTSCALHNSSVVQLTSIPPLTEMDIDIDEPNFGVRSVAW